MSKYHHIMDSWPLQITNNMMRNFQKLANFQYIIVENDSQHLGLGSTPHATRVLSVSLSLDSCFYCSHIGGKKFLEFAQS